MKFTHGSRSKFNEFQLFDYTRDLVNESTNNEHVSSGLDAEGIGVYALNGNDESNISDSLAYASSNGYSYTLSIDDFNEEDFLNYRDPDEIPREEWMHAIELFMDDVRDKKGFNRDTFQELLSNIQDFQSNTESKWLDENKLNEKELNELLRSKGLSLEVDDFYSQFNFGDIDDWIDSMNEFFDTEEPFNVIYESGGVDTVLDYAMDRSDNLWETLRHIGDEFAVIPKGNSYDSYNKTFQKHIMEHLGDYNLKAGLANNDRFVVIFDIDSIKIEDVIEHKNKIDKTHKIKATI